MRPIIEKMDLNIQKNPAPSLLPLYQVVMMFRESVL